MRELYNLHDDEEEESGFIPIFPDDDEEPASRSGAGSSGALSSFLSGSDDDSDAESSVKLTFGHIERAAKQAVSKMASEDRASDDYDDDDGESVSLSFAKAEKKEKDFVFMPFLDIDENQAEDEDDGESVSLSFAKTEKKEKDFVFMPFLDVDDSSQDDEEESRYYEEDDDDIVIIPLPDADETFNNVAQKTDSDGEEGISVVGGDIAPVPKKSGPASGPMKPAGTGAPKKKKPPQGQQTKRDPSRSGAGKPSGKQGGKRPPSAQGQGQKKKKPTSGGTDNLTHEQLFRRAMHNVNPDILRAVKNDPVQKAALEQAVRIAIVQYAAQEAVAKTNGRIGVDMLAYQKQAPGKRPPSGQGQKKKKRPPQYSSSGRPRSQRPSSSHAAASLSTFEMAPLELSSPPSTKSASGTPSAQTNPAVSTPPAQPAAAPAPVQRQQVNFNSPAAIKAAMRNGQLPGTTRTPAAQTAAQSPNIAAPLTPQQRAQAQANAAAASNRGGCLIGIIAIFVVFFIAMVAIFILPLIKQSTQYSAAVQNMSEGNYAAALRQLEESGDYEDSKTLAMECRYNLATQYQSKGDYEAAIEQYSKILKYEDSSRKIVECQYMQGKAEMEHSHYETAYNLFCEIASYSDAAELAREANYQYITDTYRNAEEKYMEGAVSDALIDYINAVSAFDNIDGFLDYKDSFSRWQIVQYKCASVMLAAGQEGSSKQLIQAADLFYELGEYQDSRLDFAIAQYNLIELDKAGEFTLSELVYGLNALSEYQPEGYEQAIASPAYTGAKLVGTWTSGEYTIEISCDNDMDSLTYSLPVDLKDSDVIVSFNDNSAMITRDGSDTELFRVSSFSPAASAYPKQAEIFCTDSNRTLTFIKQ